MDFKSLEIIYNYIDIQKHISLQVLLIDKGNYDKLITCMFDNNT